MQGNNVRQLRPAERATFDTINPASWDGLEPPRREWMVEGAIPKGQVCLLAGVGGIGKSLLAQQLCTCAALGRPWLGLSCRPGRALFFGCEDDRDELWRRQRDICRTLGVSLTDAGEAGLELAPRVDFENTLSRLDKAAWQMVVTDLFVALAERCRDLGISYVVIDTATQTFGGNQNDERHVVQFCNQLRKLAVMIEGCVILTKHPSAAGRSNGTGESGSVAWSNSVRSRLYLHKENGNTTLDLLKSNYGPVSISIPVLWQRGCFIRIEENTGGGYRPYAD